MRREYRSPGAGRSRFVLKRGFEAGLARPRTVGRGRQSTKRGSNDDRDYTERGLGGEVAVACCPGLISPGSADPCTCFTAHDAPWTEPGAN